MKNTIDVYCGSPLEIDSERNFLARLKVDLSSRGESALILANFFLPKSSLQIDFLVVRRHSVCHVELKALTLPVFGLQNGSWSLMRPDGSQKPLDVKNPYHQALDCKHAISDELHVFTRRDSSVPSLQARDKFYKHFESIVCVYPDLLPGSSIPNDFKVRGWGYPKLLDHLTSGTKSPPGWVRENWVAFAMHLGLLRSEEESETVPPDLKAAQRAIDDYHQRFKRTISHDLPPLVRTTIQRDGTSVDLATIEDSILSGRHIQLVGKSGSGKSLLVKHLMLKTLEKGRTSLFISARDYSGKLSTLIDRSIAHLHPDTCIHFLRSAERCSTPLALVVDGFNECPAKQRESLVKDIEAFCLRWNIPVQITSQEPVHLIGIQCDSVFKFAPLNTEERAAILEAYCVGAVPAEYKEFCIPFETPYELSLAAAEFRFDKHPMTRANLFDSYVSRCLENSENPSLVRSVLSTMAAYMNLHYVSSISMTQARREVFRFLTKAGGTTNLFNEALKCGLLDVQQNRCSFRHEMLERFLQADSLMNAHEATSELAQALALPSNRPVAEYILGLETDDYVIRECVEALADNIVVKNCLRGTYGQAPKSVVIRDCNKLLRKAELALEELTITWPDDATEFLGPTIAGGPEWTRYEIALMHSVGQLLHEGNFISEVIQLARKTDEAWIRETRRMFDGKVTVGKAAAIFASIYSFTPRGTGSFVAIAVIHQASRFHWYESQSTVVGTEIEQLVIRIPELTVGELALLCDMMRRSQPKYSRHVSHILERCWKTRIYHLQILVAQMIQSWGTILMGDDRSRVIELLNSYLTNENVFLNTSIVDALNVLGEIESTSTTEDVNQQIAAVLSDPTAELNQQVAHGLVTGMLDGFDQDSHYEAIHALAPDDFAQLFTMAALGDTHSFFNDWILGTLLKSDSPIALPAFLRWAIPPKRNDSSPQNAIASFVRAVTGCAKHGKNAPLMEDYDDGDRQAWAVIGQIIFLLSTPGLTRDEVNRRCEPLWKHLRAELAFEAVDPLYQLQHASIVDKEQTANALGTIMHAFPDEVRSLLEFGIRHLSKLSTLFHRLEDRQVTDFIIHRLGDIGHVDSIKLIEPYCTSPELGATAVDAMRKIKANA
jgi:hypothetical protein